MKDLAQSVFVNSYQMRAEEARQKWWWYGVLCCAVFSLLEIFICARPHTYKLSSVVVVVVQLPAVGVGTL